MSDPDVTALTSIGTVSTPDTGVTVGLVREAGGAPVIILDCIERDLEAGVQHQTVIPLAPKDAFALAKLLADGLDAIEQ